MLRRLALWCLTFLLVVEVRPASAACSVNFTENWDEAACCDLSDSRWITTQVVLPLGAGTYLRDPLATFSDEPLLPVSNAGDLELYWTNGAADAEDLATTPDSEEGNYDLCHVTMEGVFAIVGDINAAQPRAGAVARHSGPPFIGPRKFYCAYASVQNEGGTLKIRLRLEKYIGLGFEPLDIGPPASDPFGFSEAENFRVGIEVSERGDDGNSRLTGYLDRLSVVGGALHYERLVNLTGLDNDLDRGQIGLYNAAGSIQPEIGWDENIALVSPATPVRRASWGGLKTVYR